MPEEEVITTDEVLNSILWSIKKLLGIEPGSEEFDVDIIIMINSAILTLTQIGIGPNEGYRITGPNETYSDFIGEDPRLDAVKSFIYYKVRLGFDPPSSSIIVDCMRQHMDELLYRLQLEVDPPGIFEEDQEI